jgi:creatinine amidohydrolase
MAVHELMEMTWTEVDQMDKHRSMVLVPISPVEEHGPHLPLGTDLYGAAEMARMAAQRVDKMGLGYQIVLVPAIPLGCSMSTADFPGTLSVRGQTLRAVVLDVLMSLTEAGFRYLAVTNHHLDPEHMKAILMAVEEVSTRTRAVVFETASRIHYSGTKSREHQHGSEMGIDMEREVHADVRETSFVLHRYPHLVRDIYGQLPPVFVDMKAEMKKGRYTFKQMGAAQGYIGSPHLATEAMGRLHLDEGARLIADLILAAMRHEPLPAIQPAIRNWLDNQVRLRE